MRNNDIIIETVQHGIIKVKSLRRYILVFHVD